MPQQWPGVPVNPAPVQQPPMRSDPVIAPPNPYKQAEESRAQEDQRLEAERVRLAQEAAARAAQQFNERNIPTPPSGYRYAADGQTLEPIPGGPADKKAPTGQDAAGKLVGIIEAIDNAYADSADNGGLGETGFTGGILRDVQGTAAYDLAGKLKKIDADSAFSALQKMREESPTGGALGQITERELDLLKSTVANLDPNLSQEEFVRQLGIAKGVYLDMLRRVDPAKADEIEKRGTPQVGPDGTITYDERGRALLGVDGQPPSGPGGGPGPGDNLLGQFGTSTQNVLAGMVQGAGGLYDLGAMAGDAVEYGLRQGGGALLDAGGAPQAADWWRGDFRASPTVSSAVEQMSPTPQGMEASRFASQLVGGAMVPIGPKATPRAPASMNAITTPASEIVKAGKNAGVRVMTSDVVEPKTFIGKLARATGERIPVAGTGGTRSAQQEERIQAVKDIAKDSGADIADDYLDDVAADLAATRGGQLTTLKNAKDAVIDAVQAPFTGAGTVTKIDQEIARLQGIDGQAFSPVIQRLEGLKANILAGKTLRQIEGNRRLVGDLFKDDSLAAIKGDGEKAVRAVYGALRQDMGEFIKEQAGNDAYVRWAAANDRLAAMVGELESSAFKNALKSADTTPENVAKLLFSKKPSEVRKLYTNLSPEGQAKARAGIIHLAIEKAGGIDKISPDVFANVIANNSKAAGVVFHGADLDRLRGLERVLQWTKRASVAAAAPPTGVQNTPMLGVIGVGSLADAGATATIFGSYGMLARLYESTATRNLLIGLSKTKPGSKAEGEWMQRILKATAAQTERMGNVANDIATNSPARAAAQDENNPR